MSQLIGYSIACELWKISIDYYRKRCWNHTDYLNLFCITDLTGSNEYFKVGDYGVIPSISLNLNATDIAWSSSYIDLHLEITHEDR